MFQIVCDVITELVQGILYTFQNFLKKLQDTLFVNGVEYVVYERMINNHG